MDANLPLDHHHQTYHHRSPSLDVSKSALIMAAAQTESRMDPLAFASPSSSTHSLTMPVDIRPDGLYPGEQPASSSTAAGRTQRTPLITIDETQVTPARRWRATVNTVHQAYRPHKADLSPPDRNFGTPDFTLGQAQASSPTRSPGLNPLLIPTFTSLRGGKDGLLPSHMVSPPSSPDSHHGDPYDAVRKPATTSGHTWHHAAVTELSRSFASLGSAATDRLHGLFFATRMPPLRPHLPALLFLLTAFVTSTICVLLALSTLPLHLPNHITDLTLDEIRTMSMSLRDYSRSSGRAMAHTLVVLGTFFTWKQAFTVPGSLIMNVVFGAMYGTVVGTVFTSALTAFGGLLCYLLMAPLAPLIGAMPGLSKGLHKIQSALHIHTLDDHYRPIPLATPVALNANRDPLQSWTARHARGTTPLVTPIPVSAATNPIDLRMTTKMSSLTGPKSGNLWTYLLMLRLLPVVPYGLMNIACSVLRIPLLPYTVTLALGSIPWNYCTVQVGDLLVEVVSAAANAASTDAQPGLTAITQRLWSFDMMVKLGLMSLISVAPLVMQRMLQRKAEAATMEAGLDEERRE